MARTKSTARRSIGQFFIGLKKLRQLDLLNKVIENNGTSSTTIEELKNYLVALFGLFLEYNKYNKKNDTTETLDVIGLVNEKRIIEKLETINKISNIKDKEQQLIRLVIQEASNSLKNNVYFEYLENYNGDIIKPTQSSKPNINFNESLWLYTQHFFSIDGLKYLINNKVKNNSRRYNISYLNVKSKTSKDQFIQFLKLYYNQIEIDFGDLFVDEFLFHIISGNIIGCTSLESMLELFKIVGDVMLETGETGEFNSNISNAFSEYIELFQKSRELFDINEEVLDLQLSPLPLDVYKWLINHCKDNMATIDFEIVNSFYMCIESKELVDFILDNKEFYQLVPCTRIIKGDSFIFKQDEDIIDTETDDKQYRYIKEDQKTFDFGSFEIAQYFQDKLYKIYDSFSPLVLPENLLIEDSESDEENIPNTSNITIPYLNDRNSIFKSLFLKSILNCDIQEMNRFISVYPQFDIKIDIEVPQYHNRYYTKPIAQHSGFTKKKERDQILQSKFYLDQESRNSFLNHLNSNNFKCFTFSTFDYLKRSITIDPTTSKDSDSDSTTKPTTTTTTTINEFQFENQYSNFIFNSYLSMEYLLNSIYNLNFKSVEMILNLPNFKLSLSDIETIIMNERTQFAFEITYDGTYQSKFEYLDIKKMLLSLIKILPLPELNSSIQYIYFHLYKCLLQSIGIEMNNLIEIHNIYNSIGITNEVLFNNNQVFHLFYWIHLKSKKLSKVLSSKSSFGRNINTLVSRWGYKNKIETSIVILHQFNIKHPQLQFDFIYNCNNLKTILVPFIIKKKELMGPVFGCSNEEDDDEEDDEGEKEDNFDENSILFQQFGLYLMEVGELDLFLEITKGMDYAKILDYDHTIIIADSNRIEEFISLDKITNDVEWFIEGSVYCDRIDIMETLFSIYPTESTELINQDEELEKLLDYHNISFLKYMFENHYSIIYKYFEKLVNEKKIENSNPNPTFVSLGGKYKRRHGNSSDIFFNSIIQNDFECCELLLKHIPQLFKFTPSLILSLLESGRFPLIQYYLEIGTIQNNDFSVEAIKLLKSHDNLKYLKWVIDL